MTRWSQTAIDPPDNGEDCHHVGYEDRPDPGDPPESHYERTDAIRRHRVCPQCYEHYYVDLCDTFAGDVCECRACGTRWFPLPEVVS